MKNTQEYGRVGSMSRPRAGSRRRRTLGRAMGLLLVLASLAACSSPSSSAPTSGTDQDALDPGSVLVRQSDGLEPAALSYHGSSLQGATVAGTIEVFIDEQNWMREVRYAVDGDTIAVQTAAPYSVTIDTTALGDGRHVLLVEPFMPNGRVRDPVEIAFYVDNAGSGTGADEQHNRAPTVDAGADQTIQLDAFAALSATASDDGLPDGRVTYAWALHEGPGSVSFSSPSSADTVATFSAAGSYTLRVTVSDGELRAVDSVAVEVVAPVAEEVAAPEDAVTIDPASILWHGGMETGDLTEWSEPVDGLNMGCGGPQNNAGGISYASTDVARSGSWSTAMKIEDVNGDQGTRMFRGRCESSLHPEGLYYSAWFYVPVHHQTPDGWWNIFQFKSKPFGSTGGSDPMWVIDLQDRGDGTMGLRLRDKVAGHSVYHGSADIAFPIGQWVHLEGFFRGGYQDDGEIRIWQDGVELWHLSNVDTIREGGDIRWAVNNYTSSIRPDPSIIYVDDVVLATERVGPDVDVTTLR